MRGGEVRGDEEGIRGEMRDKGRGGGWEVRGDEREGRRGKGEVWGRRGEGKGS